jgi:aminopeptidase N
VLKELDFEKSTAELRLQLKADDDIAGREMAAAALGKKGGAEAIAALEDALAHDRFWGVQAAAAKALGEERSRASRDALLGSLRVRHPKARRAVVAALGAFVGDTEVLQALRRPARRDASWFVEAEAHRSIGKLRAEGSYDVLVAGMERRSFREVIRQACVDGFVEMRDERALPVIVAAAQYGAPQGSRQAAAAALGKLGAARPALAKEAGDALYPLLDDPDFRVRVAAAGGLRALQDPERAPALDRMAERELDGRAVRAAREAALALRKRGETPEQVQGLREDLEKLRAENQRLKERLERLEAARKR